MVFESILTPQEAEKNPFDMFLLGAGAASFSLWLSYYIFPQGSSMWVLFITALSIIPLIEGILAIEETKEVHETEQLFHRHYEVIWVYFFLFLGMMVAFCLWYIMIPANLSSVIFSSQLNFLSLSLLPSEILLNNLKLLAIFIILAFIFGAGAILLLTWNAAITGVIVGGMLKNIYASGFSLSIFAVLPIEIFNILGYSAGAIAGGILSVAFIRKHYKTAYFHTILLDSTVLITVSVMLIVIGAFMRYLGGLL